MYLIIRWILNALALLGISYYIVPGIRVSGFYAALVSILILALVNALIRPLIILLTLPLNILTLGLFTLVINAVLFWFVGTVVKGFEVMDFWSAFWGALLLTLASWATGALLAND